MTMQSDLFVVRCRMTAHRDKLHVNIPLAFNDAMRSVLGYQWNTLIKAWVYPLAPNTVHDVKAAVDGFMGGVEFEIDAECQRMLAAYDELQRVQDYKTADDLPEIPISKTRAWRHQKQAFWFAKDLPAAMLAIGMGGGKSKITVDLIVNRNHALTVLVAPASVVETVWPKQFETHAGREVLVCAPMGSIKKRIERYEWAVAMGRASGKPVIICTNYESVWRDECAKWLKRQQIDCLVLDECHRVKDPSGVAARFLAQLAKRIPYKLGLTGTPMPHSPLDIFAQYRVLDRTIFGETVTPFRARYAMTGYPQPDGSVIPMNVTGMTEGEKLRRGCKTVLNPAMAPELNAKFYSIAFRVGSEVLDLPEAMHITRAITLAPLTMKRYQEMRTEMVTEVKESIITANNALVRLLRLQQITSGHIKDDAGNMLKIGGEKQAALGDVFEDLDTNEPIVVFCRFTHDLAAVRAVCEKTNRRYAELSGKVRELTDWQSGGADVLGVQIQSGGVGIDLTRARYAIYYSIGFSLGDYEQSLARIHRPGQTRPVTYIHLVAKDTVDEQVYRALEERKELIHYVLEDLRGDKVDVQ